MQIAGSFSTISAAKARANLGLGPNNTPQFGSLLIGSSSGQGGVGLSNGDTNHSGYVAFYMPDSTRFGYMGYTAGANLDIAVEKSGGFVNFVAEGDRLGPRVNNNEILHKGNFPAPTVLADLADVKKRLDQPWGNPVTYYGAERSWTKDSSAAFQTAASLG
jgi:hypothetical protein